MNSRSEAIKYQLQMAHQLLYDAEILLEHGGYNSAISRLYYACFHATTALLQSRGLTAKTHNGLLAVLNKEFVLKGEFDPSQASFFSRLLRERLDGDYGKYLIIDKDEVMVNLKPTKEYITYIEILLQQHEPNQQ